MLVLNSNTAYTGDKKDLPGYWPVFGYIPAIALSLRKLSSSYSGPAIRVRRSTDNAETDIGFTSSGDLDTAALLSFCGSGNGFVSVWYDQSGNGFNATRSGAAGQPRIVSAGVVDLMGTKPGVRFDGTDDALSMVTAVAALAGKTGLSSSLAFRLRAVPTSAASLFTFYKSASSSGDTVRRRYNLGAGFQNQDKNLLQVISTQAATGNADIVTEPTPVTVNKNIVARSYLDLSNSLQGISMDGGAWTTGATSGTATGSLDSALLGGGPWTAGNPGEVSFLNVGEFILVDSKNDFFLNNIVANQQKYFTD
ncbi:arabinofuranosidase catalytic domain-containing protein [Klebsiella grimontii]|uniref:arabinofuranosidase catalytic domain-containing protein n=1 Tax=Klebsiella grimontii TaxID=2058152 RepID=UPI003D805750